MTLLDSVLSGCTLNPPRILIYGKEGEGKSTCASQAPRPIFIQTEDGLDQIGCDRFPLAKSIDEVDRGIESLINEDHSFETLVIDSLTSTERLANDAVCQEFNVKSIEQADGGYARGHVHVTNRLQQMLRRLEFLRNERRMAIVLIAHSKIEKFCDPESVAYDRYSPRLHKHASALFCEWCDAVLFATRKIRTQTEDAGFGRNRSIAHAIGAGGGERILRCVGGPSCVAKNRYGIAEELPLEWAAFVQAMSSNQELGAKQNG